MAEHKVQGGDMLLFIDPNGGTDYDTVICLTSVGISDSVNVVDASSACGPDKSPGALEISYSFEGQHLQDPDSGQISGTDLRILLRNEQTIGWKLAPENPVEGDEIQEGTGWLSELSSTYSYDSVGTFTGVLQPYGEPTITIYVNPTLTIGMSYQGGYIAFLDNTNQHGFVVYDNGANGSIANDQWAINNTPTGGTGGAYLDGETNTDAMIANTTSIIALSARNGNFNGYTDWSVPSTAEMTSIITNAALLPPTLLMSTYYWTSTENQFDTNEAMSKDASNNSTFAAAKSNVFDALAIRYF